MSVQTNAIKFWQAFEKKEPEIKKALVDQDYATSMALIENLDSLAYSDFGCHIFVDNAYSDLELTWDTGPNKTIQYLADFVCQLAPESIKKGWILNPFLPPLSQKAIQSSVQIKDSIYALNDFLMFYEIDENSQTIACKIYCPGYSMITNDENKREMSIYMLEMALGQCAYEAYICDVSCLDQPIKDLPFCNLVDGYDTVMNIVEDKGWKQYGSPLQIYSVYQPYEEFGHDSLRKDMKMIFTTHPLLIEETIEGQSDTLKDLEAKEGEFGYIYYNNLFHSKEDALYRQKLSGKIEENLVASQSGKVLGGAIGKSYSYIDIIVFDKKRFENTLKKIQDKLDPSVKLYYQKF